MRSSDPTTGHAHIWRTISEWTLERAGKTAQDGGQALAEDSAWRPKGDNGTTVTCSSDAYLRGGANARQLRFSSAAGCFIFP